MLAPTVSAFCLATAISHKRERSPIRSGPCSESCLLARYSDPTATNRSGIHVAGVCQGPKDIPDTVAQASAVAARVLGSVISGSIRVQPDVVDAEEISRRAQQLAETRT